MNELEPSDDLQGPLRRLVFLSPALLLPVLICRFPRIMGAWVIALGLALNLAPMVAHGGLMPVSFERAVAIGDAPHVDLADVGHALPGSKNVLLLQSDIHFELLSDRFRSDDLGLRSALFSVGDALVTVGVVAAALQAAWVTRADEAGNPGFRGRSDQKVRDRVVR